MYVDLARRYGYSVLQRQHARGQIRDHRQRFSELSPLAERRIGQHAISRAFRQPVDVFFDSWTGEVRLSGKTAAIHGEAPVPYLDREGGAQGRKLGRSN